MDKTKQHVGRLLTAGILLFTTSQAMTADTDGNGLLDLLDAPPFRPEATETRSFGNLGIQDLDGADQLNNLTGLFLWKNEITGIERGDFHGLANLSEVRLDDNQIERLESNGFEGLSNLRRLSLTDNQVADLNRGDFTGLTKLRELHLHDNQIRSLERGALEGLSELRMLDLAGNQISTIRNGDIGRLDHLFVLNLSSKPISRIQNGSFSGLTNLSELYLRNHELGNLERGTFRGLANLNYLNLSGYLDSIESGAFDGMINLDSLFLGGPNMREMNFSQADFDDLAQCHPLPSQGFCVHGPSVTSFKRDDATLSIRSFDVLVDVIRGQSFSDLSISNLSLVGLRFSDERPTDIRELLAFSELDNFILDQGWLESFPAELQNFATRDGRSLTVIGDGDSNQDGVFDSTDRVQVFAAGEYDDGSSGNSYWTEGDWNSDGDFDSADLVLAFESGSYQRSQSPNTASVPEPIGIASTFLATLLIIVRCRIATRRDALNRRRSPLWLASLFGVALACSSTNADISRWDTGELIPGTEGITLGPGVVLEEKNLDYANFSGADLTGASFLLSSLHNADFSGATVAGAGFINSTVYGFTKEQLYSTESYQSRNLRGLNLSYISFLGGGEAHGLGDLSGWDLSHQDLTGAYLFSTFLSDADLTGANLTNANLADASLFGANLTDATITGARFDFASMPKETLYATANYQQKNLEGIDFSGMRLESWDFRAQRLVNTSFKHADLNDVDLRGANIANADLNGSGLPIADSSTTYNQWTLFRQGYDPEEHGLTFVRSPIGDFNADNILNVEDINVLMNTRNEPNLSHMRDINEDGRVDLDDLSIWIHDFKRTHFGDADLDGTFDSSDLVQVFNAAKYDAISTRHFGDSISATWDAGDWNFDGRFNSSDLVVAFQDGGYQQSPTDRLVTVPEPNLFVITLLSFVGVIGRKSHWIGVLPSAKGSK